AFGLIAIRTDVINVNVDVIGAKTLQRAFQRDGNAPSGNVADSLAAGHAIDGLHVSDGGTELGADDPAIAPALQGFAYAPLALAGTVLLGGIDEVDAQLIAAVVNEVDDERFAQVGVAVLLAVEQQRPAELPGADADLSDLNAGSAERSLLHHDEQQCTRI